jgi:hypothetical protein
VESWGGGETRTYYPAHTPGHAAAIIAATPIREVRLTTLPRVEFSGVQRYQVPNLADGFMEYTEVWYASCDGQKPERFGRALRLDKMEMAAHPEQALQRVDYFRRECQAARTPLGYCCTRWEGIEFLPATATSVQDLVGSEVSAQFDDVYMTGMLSGELLIINQIINRGPDVVSLRRGGVAHVTVPGNSVSTSFRRIVMRRGDWLEVFRGEESLGTFTAHNGSFATEEQLARTSRRPRAARPHSPPRA